MGFFASVYLAIFFLLTRFKILVPMLLLLAGSCGCQLYEPTVDSPPLTANVRALDSDDVRVFFLNFDNPHFDLILVVNPNSPCVRMAPVAMDWRERHRVVQRRVRLPVLVEQPRSVMDGRCPSGAEIYWSLGNCQYLFIDGRSAEVEFIIAMDGHENVAFHVENPFDAGILYGVEVDAL